jgi:hypothetical protein
MWRFKFYAWYKFATKKLKQIPRGKSSGFASGFAEANFSESTTERWLFRNPANNLLQPALHGEFSANFGKYSHLCHLPKNTEITE